nr:MAG TPA: hypothetical protein [Caudoviricetes sp.]
MRKRKNLLDYFENLSSLANLRGFFLCHKGTTIHRTLIFLVCWHTMLDTVYTVSNIVYTSFDTV